MFRIVQHLSIGWVNDIYCLGVVLIPYLSAIVPYMPDRGVVRGSDSSIDSYIVPLSCIGLAEQYYYRVVIAMFLIFLDNITMHGRSPVMLEIDKCSQLYIE